MREEALGKNNMPIAELDILKQMSKNIPRLIAEAYGDRFSRMDMALAKLEQAARVVSNMSRAFLSRQSRFFTRRVEGSNCVFRRGD